MSAASQERLEALEQALALSQELDRSFADLDQWLQNVEDILMACPPVTTGQHPDVLIKHKMHNMVMKR